MDPLTDVDVKLEAVVEWGEVKDEWDDELEHPTSSTKQILSKKKKLYKGSIEKERERNRLYSKRNRERMGREASTRKREFYRKRKLANMTPEELEEYKEKDRRRHKDRRNRMTEEVRQKEREGWALRKLKKRMEKGLLPPTPKRKGPLTEEEKQRRKEKYKFHAILKRLEMTEEEKEKRREYDRSYKYFKNAAMTKEEKEKKNIRQKNWIANMTPEQKARHREQMTRGHKKMRQKWREQFPEKWEKFKQRSIDNMKKIWANETPAQRQQRLLGYRIYQKKRKLKTQLEKDGVCPEEIERRVNALVEQMKSEPLPPPPPDKSDYKPRPRKNKKANSILPAPPVPFEQSSFTSLSSSQGLVSSAPPLSQESSFVSLPSSSSHMSLSSFVPLVPSSSQGSSFIPSASSPISFQNESSSIVSPTNAIGDFDFDDVPIQPSPCSLGVPVLLESVVEFKTEASPSSPPPKRRRGRPPKNNTVAFTSISILSSSAPKITSSRGKSDADESLAVCPSSPPHQASPKTNTLARPQVTMTLSETYTTASEKIEIKQSAITNEEILLPEMCEECGETFKSKISYLIHKSEAHTECQANLTCPKCSTRCKTNQDLWEHFVNIHNMNVGSSSEDIHISASQQYSIENQELSTPTGKPSKQDQHLKQCPECGKQFRQKATLDDHIRRIHQGKGHHCDVCGADCQSLGKVWRHKVERHGMSDLPPPDGIQAVNCKYCGELIIRGYEAHVRKKHPENLEEFFNSDDQKIKLKSPQVPHKDRRAPRAKPGSLQREVKCPNCDETMKLKVLKRHLRAKHSLPCPECGKLCESLTGLDEHYRMAHALKDIEKKLEAKNLIKFVHPITKAAVCLICNANLALSDEIRAHFVSTHHDILDKFLELSCPLIECELCKDVRFITEVELRAHMDATHPDTSYTCPHCGMFRRTQADLEKHVKSHTYGPKLNRKRLGCCFICKKDFLLLNGVEDLATIKNKVRDKCKADLEGHVEQEHPESFFRCPYCPKWAYSWQGLRSHSNWCFKQNLQGKLEVDIPKKEKNQGMKHYVTETLRKMKILCRVCKLVFCMKSLKTHMELVHEIRQHAYQCEHCPRSFSLYEYWVGHVELMHDIPLEEIVLIPGPGDRPGKAAGWSRTKKGPGKAKKKKDYESEEDDGIKDMSEISNSDGDDIFSEVEECEAINKSNNNTRSQRRSKRTTRGKSSKYKNTGYEMEPVQKVRTKRKCPISTKQVKVDQYTDLEKDKRLMIYVYPLTEEDMKPYIKKVEIAVEDPLHIGFL